MSCWRIEPDNFVNQAIKNCYLTFQEILNNTIPMHKTYFDFSIGSHHFYDRFLYEYFRGTHDKLIHQKLGFAFIGCYLGEVIIKNLGGKWTILSEISSVLRGFEPFIFISIGNQYLINPVSEISWKTKHDSRINLMDYFLSLKEEMTRVDRIIPGSRSEKTYDYIFHERNLDRIFDYREYQSDELGYYTNYLTIPIPDINEWV